MPPVDIPHLPLTERLKLARTKAQLSRDTIAHALSVSTRTIIRWEKGDTPPPFEAVVQWAEMTHVPLDWLADAVDRDRLPAEFRRR